jgi:hypothetical protein
MSEIPSEIQLLANEAAVMQKGFEAQLKQLKADEARIKKTWKDLEKVMVDSDFKSIKGDWGSITIADRTVYKAEDLDEVPKKFLKRTLDTSKIKAHAVMIGELPKGVTESHTKYLTKRIK